MSSVYKSAFNDLNGTVSFGGGGGSSGGGGGGGGRYTLSEDRYAHDPRAYGSRERAESGGRYTIAQTAGSFNTSRAITDAAIVGGTVATGGWAGGVRGAISTGVGIASGGALSR